MRNGADQRFRVGMLGVGPERLRRARLDDLAQVHDRYDVGDVANDCKVVRDQEEAQREPLREIEQEVGDLRLGGCVERRKRLVEHDQGRVRRERPRDRDPLPLAAAELVRVPRPCVRGQPHELEQLDNACRLA